MKSFASDNYASVAPEIMAFLAQVNQGHVVAYGDDEYTAQATQLINDNLGVSNKKVVFVFNGTAANTLALNLCANSYHSIISANCAHVLNHEVNAPVASSGAKLVLTEHTNGKITAAQIEALINKEQYWGRHNNLPRVVTLSQATELGTVYTVQELAAIAKVCQANDILLHIDGCRLYNAAVALNAPLAELVAHADIVSLGGTKNGLMFGEAVVILNESLNTGAERLQKQLLQLDSKMRYLSAQFIPFFADKLWQKHALHANAMATRLAAGLEALGFTPLYPVASNQIFITLPEKMIQATQEKYPYYIFDTDNSIVRLVTSFDTTQTEVDDFLQIIATQLN